MKLQHPLRRLRRIVRKARAIVAGAAAVALLCTAAACSYGAYYLRFDEESPESRAKSSTYLSGSDVPTLAALTGTRYSFVVITDPHFGASRKRNDDSFLSWFSAQLAQEDEALKPRFVVNLGDTLDSGRSSQADDYNEFCDKLRALATDTLKVSDFKIYTVMGNHDTYNNGWDVWKKNIYPHTSYYRLSLTTPANAALATSGFSYYFLDSGNGTLGEAQLNDVIACLSADLRPKLVFLHYPVYSNDVLFYTLQNTMERNLLIDAFAKNRVTYVFAGHDHAEHRFTFKDKFSEHVIASFLYDNVCSLVTVDEATQKVTSTSISF